MMLEPTWGPLYRGGDSGAAEEDYRRMIGLLLRLRRGMTHQN